MLALLRLDDTPDTRITRDELARARITCRQSTSDIPARITALHEVNSELVDRGSGYTPRAPSSLRRHGARARRGHLVERGTAYPLAPLNGPRRDSVLELRAKWFLARVLPVEPNLSRRGQGPAVARLPRVTGDLDHDRPVRVDASAKKITNPLRSAMNPYVSSSITGLNSWWPTTAQVACTSGSRLGTSRSAR